MLDPLPNLHAALVHFPIALLVVGMLADLLAVVRRSADGPRRFASALLVGGALALVPTYLTGRQAGDMAESPLAAMQHVLGEHADWALRTLVFFLAYAAVRALLEWRGKLRGSLHLVAALAALAGGFLLYETAEHGGELVYRMGVGVEPVHALVEDPLAARGPGLAAAGTDTAGAGPERTAEGGFGWRFVEGSVPLVPRYLPAAGPGAYRAAWGSADSALVLRAVGADGFGLVEGPLAAAQVDARLRLLGDSARAGLVHHWTDPRTYDGLLLRDGEIQLVRVRDGEESILDAEPLAGGHTWHVYRVVASGRHLRGYQDGRLVVHGHADALPPGRAGLLVGGEGGVAVRDLALRPIEGR